MRPTLPEPLSPAARLPWEGEEIAAAPPGAPGLSLVIPVLEAGATLERTLRSLAYQDLTGVEVILMDGGSTDETPAIAERYRTLFAATSFARDGGQSEAINTGFARASQPILHWLNGDDVLRPGALSAVRAAFAADPEAQVIVGDAAMVEMDLTLRRSKRYSAAALAFAHLLGYDRHFLVQPAVFFTRAAWEAAGPLKPHLHYAMDADLFLTMAAQGLCFRHLPQELALSVYHEGCKTRARRAESITELALVQAAHGGLAEARRTLDILVGLYNGLAEGGPEAPPLPPVSGTEAVLRQRLDALRDQVAANTAALLDRAAG